MSRRRFFVERFSEGSAVLSGEAAHHLGRVLRAQPGELYELSDGREIYLARLERLGRQAAHFVLLERLEGGAGAPPALEAALLVAVVKFDRFEWALEKATELGADLIVPLAAERSVKALVAAAPKRAGRWRRILEESAQQARRLRPPALADLAQPAAAFAAAAGRRVLLSERPGAPSLLGVLEAAAAAGAAANAPVSSGAEAPEGGRTRAAAESATGNTRAAAEAAGASCRLSLAVGPEGGWSDAEFDAAAKAGFREAALGRHILRTETAVAAGLAAAQLYFGRPRPASVSAVARI